MLQSELGGQSQALSSTLGVVLDMPQEAGQWPIHPKKASRQGKVPLILLCRGRRETQQAEGTQSVLPNEGQEAEDTGGSCQSEGAASRGHSWVWPAR